MDQEKAQIIKVLNDFGIEVDNLDESSEDSLDYANEMFDKYKDQPLIFDLTPYRQVSQDVFFRDLVYYRRVMKSKLREVLSKLTVDELLEERKRVAFKRTNTWRLYPNDTPKTLPDTDFELPHGIYIEFINELLFEKRYPKNTTESTLVKQFVLLLEEGVDGCTLISKINHELTIKSHRSTTWKVKLVKEEGEYVWKGTNDMYCPTFTTPHDDLVASKGVSFSDILWKCVSY